MTIYTTDEMSVEEFTEMVRQHPVEFEPLPARFWEDERWLFEHIAELTEQYPDQWVVVYNKQVIGMGGGPRGLTEAIEQAQHIVSDGERLVTYFLESKPYVYDQPCSPGPHGRVPLLLGFSGLLDKADVRIVVQKGKACLEI